MQRWGLMWRSKNKLDGETRHLICESCIPVLFRTRREARAWIKSRYGYIKMRPDLQSEPHGWKMPVAVRVNIQEGGPGR